MSVVFILFSWFVNVDFQGWETLSKLSMGITYDALLGEDIDVPVFSDELKNWDGQKVSISGYVIPLDQSAEQEYFVLSRFPFNNCFFCGNAGPETVAEVYSNKPFRFVDTKVRVTGTLKLNADDPLHLFYIFDDATVEVID